MLFTFSVKWMIRDVVRSKYDTQSYMDLSAFCIDLFTIEFYRYQTIMK